jgi:hypothetical protein
MTKWCIDARKTFFYIGGASMVIRHDSCRPLVHRCTKRSRLSPRPPQRSRDRGHEPPIHTSSFQSFFKRLSQPGSVGYAHDRHDQWAGNRIAHRTTPPTVDTNRPCPRFLRAIMAPLSVIGWAVRVSPCIPPTSTTEARSAHPNGQRRRSPCASTKDHALIERGTPSSPNAQR